MDAVSYSLASKQAQRIEKFIENPDSASGIVTVPKVIASGETITIPAGRVAVLPNVQIDGTLNVEGEVFVPSGSIYGNRVMYEKLNYVATQGQTVFAANYDLGSVDVFVNGIRLASSDYTATTLSSITLASGVNSGDIVEIVSFGAFTVVDTYTKAETDNKLGFKANTADLKEIGVGQTWQDVTASRATGVTYTNSTGKPIQLAIDITVSGSAVATLTIGTNTFLYRGSTGTGVSHTIELVVQNGVSYNMSATSVMVNKWQELRS